MGKTSSNGYKTLSVRTVVHKRHFNLMLAETLVRSASNLDPEKVLLNIPWPHGVISVPQLASSGSGSLLLDAPGLCYGADGYRSGQSFPASSPTPGPGTSLFSSGLGSSISSSRDSTALASAQSTRLASGRYSVGKGAQWLSASTLEWCELSSLHYVFMQIWSPLCIHTSPQ